MDAVKFMKEWKRMCNTKDDCYECEAECCCNPDSEFIYGVKDEEKLVNIVCEWSKNNPQKTRLQDFLEKFPNSKLPYGTPPACAENLGYKGLCDIDGSGSSTKTNYLCKKCWNEPVE